MSPFRLSGLLLALVIGLVLAAGSGAARAQDTAAETERLSRDCRNGRGAAEACVDYGLRLYNGTGAPQDHAGALRVWRAACDKDNAMACNNASIILRFSELVAQDHPEALRLAEKGCDLGSAAACVRAGYMYRDGLGVAANAEMARRNFSIGCSRSGGDGDGCLQQGRMYADGLGIARHDGNALNSFRAGCAIQNMESCALVGFMALNGRGMTADADLAVREYRRACDGGVDFACSNLEAIRASGPGGAGYAELTAREAVARTFPANLPQEQRYLLASAALADGNTGLALAAFQALAEEGMTEAAFNLGQIYYNGQGVPQDHARAVRYFQRAVNGGHPYAQFIMAQFYQRGFLVEHNPIWAIALMRGAAEGGIADADPIWRAWQNDREAYFDAQQARMVEQHRQNEESQRQADAANMARIWGLYADRQAQREGGQVCGNIYQGGRANWQCMSRDHFDRYYNPAYQ